MKYIHTLFFCLLAPFIAHSQTELLYSDYFKAYSYGAYDLFEFDNSDDSNYFIISSKMYKKLTKNNIINDSLRVDLLMLDSDVLISNFVVKINDELISKAKKNIDFIIGRQFLNKYNIFSFNDRQNHKLYFYKKNDKIDIYAIYSLARMFYYKNSYYLAIKYYRELYDNNFLSLHGCCELLDCYYHECDYQKVYDVFQSILHKYELRKELLSDSTINICINSDNLYGTIYFNKILAKSFLEIGKNDLALEYFYNVANSSNIPDIFTYISISEVYSKMNNFKRANTILLETLDEICNIYKVDYKNANNSLSIKDDIAVLLLNIAYSYQQLGLDEIRDHYVILAAKWGDEYSVDFCDKNGLQYK